MRTVPVPGWVKATVDVWVSSANLQSGVLFRPVGKTGKVRRTGLPLRSSGASFRKAAADCDFGTVAPHDLRRTWARLCRQAGGGLEQIQFLLGHVSVQTTERYLRCKQQLRNAVNDGIGLEPDPP